MPLGYLVFILILVFGGLFGAVAGHAASAPRRPSISAPIRRAPARPVQLPVAARPVPGELRRA